MGESRIDEKEILQTRFRDRADFSRVLRARPADQEYHSRVSAGFSLSLSLSFRYFITGKLASYAV